MKELRNEWFTRLEDLREEAEYLGFQVEELNPEILVISYEKENATVYETYRLGGTENTIYINVDSKIVEVVR